MRQLADSSYDLKAPSPLPSQQLDKRVPGILGGRSAMGHPAPSVLFAASPISRGGLGHPALLATAVTTVHMLLPVPLALVSKYVVPMFSCRGWVANTLIP